LIAAFVSSQDALPGRVGYGTVQVRRCESGADFVMPDQRLPEPPESPTPAPAPQADAAQQSGAVNANLMPLTPDNPAAPLTTPTSHDQGPNRTPQRIPYWLQQAERFLRVIVRMYLGLLVCCAPWYPPAWDNNPLFASSPWLTAFVTHGAVRGIVSGLGILNLWIAVRDALRTTSDRDSN
jgi:hypothetical protein